MIVNKLNPYFILGLLVFIFIAPLILASLLYIKHPAWLTQKTLNKGKLIYPALDFKKLKKKIIFHKKIHTAWQIFYLTNSSCLKDCQRRLHILHQVILALGKKSSQINAALIQIDPTGGMKNNRSINNYSITTEEYLRFFINNKMAMGYYLVEPTEKIILYYRINTPGESIYKDLTHLL
ncbi:MAG: hypothetical protein V4471_07665 [Pseudomonadota bacterium]